ASILFKNAVAADRCGAAGFAHRSGHYARDLSVDADGERVRGDAGDADHRGAGGVVSLEAAQRHSDVAVRGPESGRLPLERIVIEPFDSSARSGDAVMVSACSAAARSATCWVNVM